MKMPGKRDSTFLLGVPDGVYLAGSPGVECPFWRRLAGSWTAHFWMPAGHTWIVSWFACRDNFAAGISLENSDERRIGTAEPIHRGGLTDLHYRGNVIS
jgi:hypothetical protein